MPDRAATEEFETGLDVSTKTTKAPCLINGNIRMVRACLLSKGHDAIQFTQKQFTVSARAPNDNTCVIRASANQHLTKDFASIQRNPGGSVRQWVQSKHSGSAKMVGDTWGWQQQGAIVTGLLRVDRNLTCAILRTSGQKAQNNRWFFEPLRYDDKLSAPFDKLPLTTWVEDKGKGLEQSAADAEIQAAKVGMGLKLGYRQIGVRQTLTIRS